ncbi:MAG: HD domain-containing protein [Spirochaetaceae bacterium]|nr:HD domain-containing protein [Spirochaetaceae bacterium]
MELTKRKRLTISLLYGMLIVAAANFIGSILPIPFKMPAQYLTAWNSFLEVYYKHLPLILTGTFAVPTCLCIMYMSKQKNENFYRRFINLPVAFSLLGSVGWIIFFLAIIVTMLAAKTPINIPVLLILFMFCTLKSLLSFTIAYFTLETIHRKIILPKFFPEGHLNKFNRISKMSLKFLFFAFYISTGIFPLLYLLAAYVTTLMNSAIEIDMTIIMILGLLVIAGIVLCLIFDDYFDSPLKKLQKGTEVVKSGDYAAHIDIVTTDAFGGLADSFNEMTESLDEKTKKILSIQNSIVTGMATMVESRDNSTGGHIKRTSSCVEIFINKLKTSQNFSELTQDFCASVIKAAPMHDLGKIAVPDAILQKPGKFTDDEYEKMKTHSAEGARIVENILYEVDDLEFKQIAINVAHYHHEKWDGTGYPDKLCGTQIPIEARIMALADVFDALVSKRCYKDSFSYDKAFEIIQESLGTHFDPELGKLFIQCRAELEELYNSYA